MKDRWDENYGGIPGNIYLGEENDDTLLRLEQIMWIILGVLTAAMIISTIVRYI